MLSAIHLVAAEGGGGFDPLHLKLGGEFFWTLIIFGLSLPLMWKLVFGPIAKALEERDERAESAIARAEEAKTAAEAARNETVQQLEAARAEAQQQLREARERAEKQATDLLAKARAEADADRQRAVAEINAERQRAVAEIRDLAVDVSLDAATRLMKRDMKGDDQKSFVKGFLDDVEVLQKS